MLDPRLASRVADIIISKCISCPECADTMDICPQCKFTMDGLAGELLQRQGDSNDQDS